MTTRNCLPLMEYSFRSDDDVFLDTNVWLCIFGPHKPGDWRSEFYSEAFSRILYAKSRVHIDILVVSEFINTYARFKWKLVGREFAEFKDFRWSPAFKTVARDIASDLKSALAHCTWTEHGLSPIDLIAMIDEFAGGDSDINDLAIARICRSHGFKLITHDADFRDEDVFILTANKRLLRGN
jgi:predicted nucleic acid-binding protein